MSTVNHQQLRAVAVALKEIAPSLGKDADVQGLYHAAKLLDQSAQEAERVTA